MHSRFQLLPCMFRNCALSIQSGPLLLIAVLIVPTYHKRSASKCCFLLDFLKKVFSLGCLFSCTNWTQVHGRPDCCCCSTFIHVLVPRTRCTKVECISPSRKSNLIASFQIYTRCAVGGVPYNGVPVGVQTRRCEPTPLFGLYGRCSEHHGCSKPDVPRSNGENWKSSTATATTPPPTAATPTAAPTTVACAG